MKDRTIGLYRRVSFTIEIVFGLVLILNGMMLISNYFGLFSFQEMFPNFFSFDAFWGKSTHEWRSSAEFIHTMIATHISVFVMVFLGIVILAARLHTKKSL